MQKILSYHWLPITAGLVVILIYGTLNIADLKIKNQKSEQKQNELQSKIVQLENNLGNLNVQMAGIEEKKKSTSKTVLAAKDEVRNEVPTLPTPIPSLAVKKTPTPTPTSTPTPTPTLTPTPVSQASVAIENVGTYTVDLELNDTAFSILLRAGLSNNFNVEYQTYEGMGAFVSCIAGICTHDNFYWAFYYNGSYSMVGASVQVVSPGDTTMWKFESF